MEKDKYDLEIDELISLPPEQFSTVVNRHWISCFHLFQYLNKKGRAPCLGEKITGCPTMVKNYGVSFPAETITLTEAVIRSDLIPVNVNLIRQDRSVLEEFARIQRLADVELNRVIG